MALEAGTGLLGETAGELGGAWSRPFGRFRMHSKRPFSPWTRSRGAFSSPGATREDQSVQRAPPAKRMSLYA